MFQMNVRYVIYCKKIGRVKKAHDLIILFRKIRYKHIIVYVYSTLPNVTSFF
ncbi:hypothetical protein BGLY_0270 [Bacillus glycinifermentans]|nr:hypothetical protein BGLY_0270 [Bacillus glycinifermentans]